jgi:hypothetical protein
LLERALEQPVAMWRTEPEANTFTRLPVRAGDYVVWLAAFPDEAHGTFAAARLAADPGWRALLDRLAAAGATAEPMRLAPTATSRHPAPLR